MVLKRNMPIVIVNDSSTASRFRNTSGIYNAISIDLEGNNLCRTGQIYTIQIFIPSLNEAYIFDCRKLEKSDVIQCFQNILADNNINRQEVPDKLSQNNKFQEQRTTLDTNSN